MHFTIYSRILPFLMGFLLFQLLSFQVNGQIWTKIYWYTSGDKPDSGAGVVETSDGALIVAGGYLGHLVKIDRNGDILWKKSFPEIEQANDLTLTSDGGICLIGYNQTTDKTWMIKTNASGDKQWAKLLENYTGITEILENKDGGLAILGPGLIITDVNGNTIRHNPDISGGTFIKRFTQLTNGQYVIVGATKMLLLNASGENIWELPLNGPRSVAATSDGNFVIMGYAETDASIYLTKWDTDGNEIWFKTYPQLDVRPFQVLWNKMVVNPYGEIAFIAYVDGVSAFIAKTDGEGNLLCARTQALDGLSVTLENMTATADKGFAIVGTSAGPDLFVMKTDSLCQTDDLEIIYNVDGNVDTVFSKKFSFKFSPNPCSDKVTFEIQPTEPFDGKMMLVFYDAWGRAVKKEIVANGTLPVFMDDLASGMYFFRFKKDGKTLGKGKLAVQR